MTVAEFQKKLAKIAAPDFFEKPLNLVGRDVLKLIRVEFAKGIDPYGAPWAKTKKKRGKTLIETGDLRGDFDYSVAGNTLLVFNDTEYAAYLQPKRNMLPTTAKGLPTAWNSVLTYHAANAIRDALS